mmetsp:Transcript_45019/g.143368  ORF Transcript_45019/g.143368 Transcript_45019/m.143368 type:complete len:200 (-) Transcript_45019:188-787(-)
MISAFAPIPCTTPASRGAPTGAVRPRAQALGRQRSPFIASCMRARRHVSVPRVARGATAQMYIPPSDKTPERKTVDTLHNFFTFIAVKIVLAQLEACNSPDYDVLRGVVDSVSLQDGDVFCSKLLKESPTLGMRLMEVRRAYVDEDFNWDTCETLSKSAMKDSNTNIMRDYLIDGFSLSSLEPPASVGAEADDAAASGP